MLLEKETKIGRLGCQFQDLLSELKNFNDSQVSVSVSGKLTGLPIGEGSTQESEISIIHDQLSTLAWQVTHCQATRLKDLVWKAKMLADRCEDDPQDLASVLIHSLCNDIFNLERKYRGRGTRTV